MKSHSVRFLISERSKFYFTLKFFHWNLLKVTPKKLSSIGVCLPCKFKTSFGLSGSTWSEISLSRNYKSFHFLNHQEINRRHSVFNLSLFNSTQYNCSEFWCLQNHFSIRQQWFRDLVLRVRVHGQGSSLRTPPQHLSVLHHLAVYQKGIKILPGAFLPTT